MGKRKKINIQSSKVYGGELIIFLSLFIFVFLSPNFMGKNYNIDESIINEYQLLGNNVKAAVVNKEYNPNQNLLRVDISVTNDISNSYSLSDIEYDAEAFLKNEEIVNHNNIELKVVDDGYLILFIADLKPKYDLISINLLSADYDTYDDDTVAEENIDPDIFNTYFYLYEENIEINNNLEIKEIDSYRNDVVNFRQKEIDLEIGEINQKLDANLKDISKNNEKIIKMKNDLQYQTKDEQMETKSEIEFAESNIEKTNEENAELNKMITDLKEKKILLEKRKK